MQPNLGERMGTMKRERGQISEVDPIVMWELSGKPGVGRGGG